MVSTSTVNAISKTFNKAGYRLAEKVIGQPIKNIVDSATKANLSVIEHVSGKKTTIVSFFDDAGNLVKRRRMYSNSPVEKHSFYEKITQKVRTKQTKTDEELYNPNAYTNKGLVREDVFINTKTKQRLRDKYSVCDINPESRTVTISEAQRDYKTDLFVDQTKLTEKVNGEKTKWFYQKSESKPNELNQVVDTQSFGLSEYEIKMVSKNPYLYAMLKAPANCLVAAKPRALYNQSVDTSIPLILKKNMSNGLIAMAGIEEGKHYIVYNKEALSYINRLTLLAFYEHEARHIWQRKLIEKLDAGLLTNSEEIKLAQAFKHNSNNYVTISENVQLYRSQLVERDAFGITRRVAQMLSEWVDKMQMIFTKATRRTLGE